MALPRSIAGAANHKIKAIFGLADVRISLESWWTDMVLIIAATQEAERSLEAYKSQDTKRRHTVVFDGLQSISDDQMVAEAVDILTAGSDTTAYSLSTGTWHILSNPGIKKKLVDALNDAIPDRSSMPTITKLEEIKYLVDTTSPNRTWLRRGANDILECLCKRSNTDRHTRSWSTASSSAFEWSSFHCRWQDRTTWSESTLANRE